MNTTELEEAIALWKRIADNIGKGGTVIVLVGNVSRLPTSILNKCVCISLDERKKIKCPDCGEEIEEVNIERFAMKAYTVDYENKKFVPVPDAPWEVNDHAIHCPHCDTLNLDELMTEFTKEEE